MPGEVNNIFTDKTVRSFYPLKIQILLSQLKIIAVKSVVGKIDLHTQTVYIDDPFVIDEVRYTYGIDNSSLDHSWIFTRKAQ